MIAHFESQAVRRMAVAALVFLALGACMSKKPRETEDAIVVSGGDGSDEEIAPLSGTGVETPSAPRPVTEPPPMSPPPPPAASSPDGTMRERSMKSAESDVAVSPPPGSGGPSVQAGTLTAGDYDDVLNPGLYRRYLDDTRDTWDLGDKDLPYVDAEQRVTVKVVDRLGKPVPFADVSLATPGGKDMFSLKTGATGTIYLYPGFDAIESGTRLRVGTSANSPNVTSAISKNALENGGVITLTLAGDAPKVRKMDVLLTLDATGSMTDEMAYLQAELDSIFRRLKSKYPDVDLRAGLIVYRDHGDEYVTRDFGFTSNVDEFRKNLAAQSAYDGGDMPEAMDAALKKGLEFGWRDDAVKVNLLVADAPPHDQDIGATWNAALMARVEGIHIVPVAASGVDDTAEFMMRAMGQLTNGRYLFLTDDSGVGNPHAEPKVDCYVVTRLNGLVERVLVSLMTGNRVEPEGSDVIRTVGNYKAGVCKVQ